MHTFKGKEAVFIYNSDLSGDVIIQGSKGNYIGQIPASDLLDFVANFVRSEKIANLENTTTYEILGIPDKKKSTNLDKGTTNIPRISNNNLLCLMENSLSKNSKISGFIIILGNKKEARLYLLEDKLGVYTSLDNGYVYRLIDESGETLMSNFDLALYIDRNKGIYTIKEIL